jgi:hypothetical protein
MTRTRVVNPLSLMTDVFVELERLHCNLEALRDEMVEHPDADFHIELYDARHNCRRIMEELRSISSLMSLHRHFLKGDAPTPPKGPPKFKLVS